MQINEKCLPCLINQVIKTASICNVSHRNELYKKVFSYLSTLDFQMTNPEIIGHTFALLKEYTHCDDPYFSIRRYYNDLFLKYENDFDYLIGDSFIKAIKYAIIGNVIDYSPLNNSVEDKLSYFKDIDHLNLAIDHSQSLYDDLKTASSLLYLGDNCGEIVFDKLFIKRIKQMHPQLKIYFATRGSHVVNDNVEEDAYYVKMDEYATIINNGDSSLGTIIHRTSPEFLKIYHQCDIVISKGQANYESLSEEKKNIYFLLMVKCDVIADYIKADKNSLVCYHHQL